MNSRARFARAIDSQFRHLGREATYVPATQAAMTIRVIARRPEQMFELGEGRVHGEDPELEFRVSEVPQPCRGDEIHLDGRAYRLEAEPRLDLHQLVWIAPALPVERE